MSDNHKQTSPKLSTLAARVLKGYNPTSPEIRSLAASVLSQDEDGEEILNKTHLEPNEEN